MIRNKFVFLSAILLSQLFVSCEPRTPDEARQRLTQANISFNDETFIQSASKGDLEIVNLFLKAGVNPDARDPIARLAHLFYKPKALEPTLADTVQFEIDAMEKAAPPQTKATGGTTALMVAAINGHAEVVKALLAKRADANLTDRVGMSALTQAAWKGHTEIVRILLKAGADPNAKVANQTFMTPLDVAAVQPSGGILREEIIKLLLDKGATAGAWASKHPEVRDVETVRSLFTKAENGETTNNRLDLSPDKALLGHWLSETGGVHYYISPETFYQIETRGNSWSNSYSIVGLSETESKIVVKIILPSTYVKNKTFTFAANKLTVSELEEFGSTPLRSRWVYVDDKQKP